jgi:hypothetical protein
LSSLLLGVKPLYAACTCVELVHRHGNEPVNMKLDDFIHASCAPFSARMCHAVDVFGEWNSDTLCFVETRKEIIFGKGIVFL